MFPSATMAPFIKRPFSNNWPRTESHSVIPLGRNRHRWQRNADRRISQRSSGSCREEQISNQLEDMLQSRISVNDSLHSCVLRSPVSKIRCTLKHTSTSSRASFASLLARKKVYSFLEPHRVSISKGILSRLTKE